MAKIGDYIHLHFNNYRRYGITFSSEKNNKGRATVGQQRNLDLTNFLTAARNEVKTSLAGQKAQDNLKQLQSIANQILSNKSTGQDSILDDATVQGLRRGITTYLQKNMSKLNEGDIDWEHLTFKPSALEKLRNSKFMEEYSLKFATLKGNTRYKNSKRFHAKTFQNHIKNINQGFEEVKNSLKAGDRAQIEKELRDLSQFATRLPDNTMIDASKGSEGALSRSRLFKVAQDIFKLNAIATLEGTLLEATIAAAGSVFHKTMNNTVEDLINEMVKGLDKSSLIYKADNFGKKINLDQVFANQKNLVKSSDGSIYYNVLETQGKVDVAFSLDDTPYYFSAKNYDLRGNTQFSNIHLVSKTSLKTSLQTEALFLNHYLNQTVESKDQSKQDCGPNGIIRKQANKTMRKMLFLKALVGGNLYKNSNLNSKANVFAVNDKSQPCGIRFISMSDILDKIYKLNTDTAFSIEPEFTDKQSWANNWAKTKEARINNVLQQVANYKYSVQVQKTAIKQAIYRK